MNPFTKIYRFSWLILLLLFFFLDRDNPYWVITTILLLVVLSVIAVLRSLESRKEWRKYIEKESLDWVSISYYHNIYEPLSCLYVQTKFKTDLCRDFSLIWIIIIPSRWFYSVLFLYHVSISTLFIMQKFLLRELYRI